MCTYIKVFPYIAIQRWQQLSNFAFVVQKWLRMTKFVRTKSDAVSKFYNTSLSLLCTGDIVVVHLYYGF